MTFICDYCNLGCSSKGNILSHMLLKHTPHVSFKCALCNQKSKIYSQKKNIRIHLKKSHFGGPGVSMTKKLRKRIDKKIIEINDLPLSNEQKTGNMLMFVMKYVKFFYYYKQLTFNLVYNFASFNTKCIPF